jgi:membrane protease YdiL (CAAX protease family)
MATRTREPAQLWEPLHIRYVAIAFGWSWVFWIGGWLLARAMDTGDVLYNENLVEGTVLLRNVPGDLMLVSAVSLIAVWGPMLAGIIISRSDPAIPGGDLWDRIRRVGVGWHNYRWVLGVLAIVTAPPLLFSMLAFDQTDDAPGVGTLAWFLLAFFVYEMLTSATEEIGWRGYLLEKLLPGRDFWDAGWLLGWVWAAWHLPVLLFIFLQQGMIHVQIIGSAAGFAMGIVAMSIFHAWFYERTKSVFLNMVIHAAFNTIPLTIVLLYQESPAAVAANLLLWAVVFYLRKKESIGSSPITSTVASEG